MADPFARALQSLGNFPDKGKIDSLCMLAEDALGDVVEVDKICKTLLKQLTNAEASCKIPVLYTLDAIVKKHGKEFEKQLAPAIADAVVTAFTTVNSADRQRIQRTVKSWADMRKFIDQVPALQARLIQAESGSDADAAPAAKRMRADTPATAATTTTAAVVATQLHVPITVAMNVAGAGVTSDPRKAAGRPTAAPSAIPQPTQNYAARDRLLPQSSDYTNYYGHKSASVSHAEVSAYAPAPGPSFHSGSDFNTAQPQQQHGLYAQYEQYPNTVMQYHGAQPYMQAAAFGAAPEYGAAKSKTRRTLVTRPAISAMTGALSSLLSSLVEAFPHLVPQEAIRKFLPKRRIVIPPGIGYEQPQAEGPQQLSIFLTEISNSILSTRDSTPIYNLHDRQPYKCGQCGLRFPEIRQLGRHEAAGHNAENNKQKKGLCDLESRQWYVGETAWVDPDYVAVTPGVADNDAVSEAGSEENEFDHVVTASTADMVCAACGDEMEKRWFDVREEWVWVDAIQVGPDVFHTACAMSFRHPSKTEFME